MKTGKEIFKQLSNKKLLILCFCLFAFSVGVRLLVWQNNKVDMLQVQWMLVAIYLDNAKILLSGDLNTFLFGLNPPANTDILLHPPGYPILLAAFYFIFRGLVELQIIHIFLNSLAPILVFLITLKLFDYKVAGIAGFLVAVSPQFAYHSSLILPDSFSVLPILLAIYFFIQSYCKQRLIYSLLCGLSLGISCWLRSNALFLPLFFAFFSLILLPKQIRIRFAFFLVVGFILIISPITIRNYLAFHSFVPLSLGAGTTFVEGIADYDKEGRFGLPSTDSGVMEMDARIFNRPEYLNGLYNLDGVERERERIKVGLSVVRENPFWFLSVVGQRAFSFLRLERVPAIAPERDEKETTNTFVYYLNVPLKIFQRLFITAIFLPLFIIGIVILCRTKEERKKLLILLIVPLYFMCFQSLLHSEYRYVLALTHIIFIISAVTFSFLINKIGERIFSKSSE